MRCMSTPRKSPIVFCADGIPAEKAVASASQTATQTAPGQDLPEAAPQGSAAPQAPAERDAEPAVDVAAAPQLPSIIPAAPELEGEHIMVTCFIDLRLFLPACNKI